MAKNEGMDPYSSTLLYTAIIEVSILFFVSSFPANQIPKASEPLSPELLAWSDAGAEPASSYLFFPI